MFIQSHIHTNTRICMRVVHMCTPHGTMCLFFFFCSIFIYFLFTFAYTSVLYLRYFLFLWFFFPQFLFQQKENKMINNNTNELPISVYVLYMYTQQTCKWLTKKKKRNSRKQKRINKSVERQQKKRREINYPFQSVVLFVLHYQQFSKYKSHNDRISRLSCVCYCVYTKILKTLHPNHCKWFVCICDDTCLLIFAVVGICLLAAGTAYATTYTWDWNEMKYTHQNTVSRCLLYLFLLCFFIRFHLHMQHTIIVNINRQDWIAIQKLFILSQIFFLHALCLLK